MTVVRKSVTKYIERIAAVESYDTTVIPQKPFSNIGPLSQAGRASQVQGYIWPG